jgi:hypothetical protein
MPLPQATQNVNFATADDPMATGCAGDPAPGPSPGVDGGSPPTMTPDGGSPKPADGGGMHADYTITVTMDGQPLTVGDATFQYSMDGTGELSIFDANDHSGLPALMIQGATTGSGCDSGERFAVYIAPNGDVYNSGVMADCGLTINDVPATSQHFEGYFSGPMTHAANDTKNFVIQFDIAVP